MPKRDNYTEKFETGAPQTLFPRLDPEDQAFVRRLAETYFFTFQELRQVSQAALDLGMWGETPLKTWWQREEVGLVQKGKVGKKHLLLSLQAWLQTLKTGPKSYPEQGLERPAPPSLKPVLHPSNKTIIGMCPVASDATVCCNLRTIDAVENCGFGCSYCTIQTFYEDQVAFDANLEEKLAAVELDPDRFYHIGTGQSSDSLMWGNQHGILDTLCEFARAHPNILLEFKTKSRNIAYFLQHRVPRNIVLSWSLNTPTIIRNEEHFTATLEQRLDAARQVADRHIDVAFHFHPMVHYQGGHTDYQQVAENLMARFTPAEVLFVSFGSVTLIKPAIQAIRQRGGASKILQMELVPDPKGKLTYPDSVKAAMFSHIYQVFAPWHGEVFFYLCMEKAALWESTFGRVFQSNQEFETEFGRQVRAKQTG